MRDIITIALLIIGFIGLMVGGLSLVGGVAATIYFWAAVDLAFKSALWIGFKWWAGMLVTGVVGYIFWIIGVLRK